MSKCRESTPLAGALPAAGLFEDVGNLSSGRVRLRLRGARMCQDVRLPFYEFDIETVDDDAVAGTIAFFPERDPERVGPLGQVGGELDPARRGAGLFGDAMKALTPLAARHGLQELIVSIPSDGAAGIRASEKLDLAPIAPLGSHVRFAMRVRE